MNNLNKELIKKTLGNLGVVPGVLFGKVGITPSDFILKDKVSIDDGDYAVWAGELHTQLNKFKALLTRISQKGDPDEFILLLSIDHALLGVRFIWDEEDTGLFLIQANDKWIPANTFVQLNVTAVVESVTNEGILWQPYKDCADIYPAFLSLLEVDDDA